MHSLSVFRHKSSLCLFFRLLQPARRQTNVQFGIRWINLSPLHSPSQWIHLKGSLFVWELKRRCAHVDFITRCVEKQRKNVWNFNTRQLAEEFLQFCIQCTDSCLFGDVRKFCDVARFHVEPLFLFCVTWNRHSTTLNSQKMQFSLAFGSMTNSTCNGAVNMRTLAHTYSLSPATTHGYVFTC